MWMEKNHRVDRLGKEGRGDGGDRFGFLVL